MLLLRVCQPFHQAALVNELDASATFAWIKQRFFFCSLSVANAASIHVLDTLVPLIESWIVHQVWERRQPRWVAEGIRVHFDGG